MLIYQAGPLFTAAEISWHKAFKQKLTAAGYQVQWPGDFFSKQEIEAWGAEASKNIMERDRAAILSCDLVVALLDGTQVDDGTAWEIGYAYALGKAIIGIRTDMRKAGDTNQGCVNAMIEGSCLSIETDEEGVLKAIEKLILQGWENS